jgi:site-specific DNA-cytosine methylase
VSPTLNSFDVGDTRATTLAVTVGTADDPLLPLGQDSKRYRVIGNGVATPCAEWIGHRLMAYLQEHA